MASLIKGKTVVLYDRVQTGTDAFHHPVYEEIPVAVSNVLICPSGTEDIVGNVETEGKRAVYELCIPKENTNVWEDRVVEFYGRKWKTFGIPLEYIAENVPLDRNRKVRVERYG